MSFPRVSAPRAAWRLLRALLQLLKGVAIVALKFPSLDAAGRHREIQRWSAGVLKALGVALVVEGHPRAGAGLVVANHVSWLDIAALHACCPQARFVSKADVLGWPVVGWLVRSVGTLFIERASKRDALRVVHQMAEALQAGQCVAVFPEGTTSDGQGVLPFHANLLHAAITTATPIQPAVLRYADPLHAVSPAAEFVGNTTLLQSVWNIVSARGLTVRVRWLPSQASAHADRRALAAALQQQVEQALQRG
ncbi:1-acyl-sn-glycerol-3-phosphate acyltransferase [Aquincola sp. J276]|uniref:lysophospholipid acyltransferase family protein n=1 Tax=Aquincola sp. J276 TaxID=2898432 RepID=UPI000A4EA40E|nr:lysophospholipid acyltransferase family protein [Aquincola sp. J276]MCR5866904.1 1-acyl-sn-glycerol-3-phosphate acyltransferase [Aquincola sp. J276]